MRAVASFILAASFASGVWYACTLKVDVPQPKVEIGCVLIELPGGTKVLDCGDGGR
jgi:hypothetical protein